MLSRFGAGSGASGNALSCRASLPRSTPRSIVRGLRALSLGMALSACEGGADDRSSALPSSGNESEIGTQGNELKQESRSFGEVDVLEAGRLVIGPATRISVAADVERGARTAMSLTEGAERQYAQIVSDILVAKVRDAGRPWSIAATPGTLADDGRNILIELDIGLNRSGVPYRIALTARQGSHRWSAVLERPSLRRVPGNIPISPNNTTPDGRPYWDEGRDVRALALRLSEDIQFGR